MNNLSSDKIINALPIRIVQGLESALSLLPDSDTAIIEKPESEGAFNHILFVTTATGRYVFRARRESSAEEIKDYMGYMYESTGFIENGGTFKIRDISEEIDFIKRALNVGLPVPKLVLADQDWMLIEYIEGRTLWSYLDAGEVVMLPKVLSAIIFAHKRGIVYADRWGGNELIDSSGKARMIDFDIEWHYHGVNDGTLESLEIAFIIFNSMRLTSKRNDLLEIVETDVMYFLKKWDYQIPKIGNFIEGLSNFYLSPNKPSSDWSLSSDLYSSMSEPANRLVGMFSKSI